MFCKRKIFTNCDVSFTASTYAQARAVGVGVTVIKLNYGIGVSLCINLYKWSMVLSLSFYTKGNKV